MSILVTVLAHNEEQRIAACLESLPIGLAGLSVHVIVNGSSDRTAAIARAVGGDRLTVHEYAQGGKSRNWNRFTLDDVVDFADVHVFVDGDAVVASGSIAALVAALDANPGANAASAFPLNGRSAGAYRRAMAADHGIFGDLYAVRGPFLARMKAAGIRLPDDLIGDDGLIGALAKTDLGPESDWDDSRIVTCAGAGFYCEPTTMLNPATWRVQYRRMINYSIRHFQNRIVSAIMRSEGPTALPPLLRPLYPAHLAQVSPRQSAPWWWFDRIALKRMRALGLPG